MHNVWWENECEGTIAAPMVNIEGTGYYLSGICVIYSDNEGLCERSYSTIFENNKSFCEWINISPNKYLDPIKNENVSTGCVVNSRVNCEDLSESTSPQCSQVPGCREVNVIYKKLNWLKL